MLKRLYQVFIAALIADFITLIPFIAILPFLLIIMGYVFLFSIAGITALIVYIASHFEKEEEHDQAHSMCQR